MAELTCVDNFVVYILCRLFVVTSLIKFGNSVNQNTYHDLSRVPPIFMEHVARSAYHDLSWVPPIFMEHVARSAYHDLSRLLPIFMEHVARSA